MVPLIILAVGAGGLSIATDSPDALCPPLDEARQVIAARVGAVTGGAFEARYGMRRDTNSGESLVVLTLRDEQQTLLLEREIPVLNGECADVALALALILERYFTDIEAGTEASSGDATDVELPPKNDEAIESSLTVASAAQEPPNGSAGGTMQEHSGELAQTEPTQQSDAPGSWTVRALLGVGQWLAPQVGLGGGFQLKPWCLLSVDTSFQLIRSELESNGYLVSTIRHAIYASSMFGGELFARSWWGIGPSLGGQLQIAELVDESTTGTGAQTRAFASLGVQGTALWNASERVQLGVLGRGSMLLWGADFLVSNAQGDETTVLDLPMLTWDTALFASFRF